MFYFQQLADSSLKPLSTDNDLLIRFVQHTGLTEFVLSGNAITSFLLYSSDSQQSSVS